VNKQRGVLFVLFAAAGVLRAAAGPAALSRAFEFRAVSPDPAANGETDFKGKTAVFSTEDRVAFLNAYAEYASAWYGNPRLDRLAVEPAETEACLARIKPQPLPSVRRMIRLNEGWRKAAFPVVPTNRPAPWRGVPGVQVGGGVLSVSAGKRDLLDLGRSAGWRYEIAWRARCNAADSRAVWAFASAPEASFTVRGSDRWHAFRLQADLVSGRGYLYRDGRRVADFPLPRETSALRFALDADDEVCLDDLVFIDYQPMLEKIWMPYKPVVLADDGFDDTPALTGWTDPGFNDASWSETELPAVHGGFREAGEALCLRRRVDLAAADKVWLEIEALDPSGEVYFNGDRVGVFRNRRPVWLDVTARAKPGANLLALKVDPFHLKNPMGHMPDDRAVGWFAGRVTLHLLSGDVSVKHFFVHTEALEADGSARQTHRLMIENTGSEPFEGKVRIRYREWFPKEGKEAARQEVPVRVEADSSREFVLPLGLDAPRLWCPEKPVLYAVTATLSGGDGKPADEVVTTTGIRTVGQHDGMFFLNNKPAMLNGAQTMGLRPAPAVENSVKHNRCAPPETLISEMLAIKKMGGNLLRVHVHAAIDTPDGINDPRLAEFADQIGLALMWGTPSWLRSCDERAIDCDAVGFYMRQVYNHPSIVMWELSNHPNTFKKADGPERTHAFVSRTVRAVLSNDTSRLLSPTTFWQHTHYANDLGTRDWKNRAITPVPEYTHPLVTRGTQDAVTGYGAEWTALRAWPTGFTADCLKNRTRAFFNFEHEESAAQPNWSLAAGWPWYRLRSYEAPYEEKSIGRILAFEEWRASQAWQAFSAYESMRKQIWHGVSGFSWCTIEGGANSGTYEKPLLDPFGHAKLAWHIHQTVFQPVFAGSDDVDTVYGPGDRIVPCVFHLGDARTVDLTVTVKTPAGEIVDQVFFPGLGLAGGRSLRKLPAFRPKLPAKGYCAVEYAVSMPENRKMER
jgi:hypothetical protein